MLSGANLGKTLTGRVGLEIRTTVQGGLRILEKIEASRLRRVSPPPGPQPLDWPLASAQGRMTPDRVLPAEGGGERLEFYYSFLFLPPERRRAITALYAFCREVDDVVDETSDAQLAATKLAWWRVEVGDLFAGNPHHP
jgi:hypothetical protein